MYRVGKQLIQAPNFPLLLGQPQRSRDHPLHTSLKFSREHLIGSVWPSQLLWDSGVMSINLAAEPERASAQNKVGAMVQDHSMFTDLTKEKGHGTWCHTNWRPSYTWWTIKII